MTRRRDQGSSSSTTASSETGPATFGANLYRSWSICRTATPTPTRLPQLPEKLPQTRQLDTIQDLPQAPEELHQPGDGKPTNGGNLWIFERANPIQQITKHTPNLEGNEPKGVLPQAGWQPQPDKSFGV